MGRRILRRRGFHHRLLSEQEEESLPATAGDRAAERTRRDPEVLRRFQVAMLGMGKIVGPNEYGVYVWRTRGFEETQATIALLGHIWVP